MFLINSEWELASGPNPSEKQEEEENYGQREKRDC
jgi:hypothetical protein